MRHVLAVAFLACVLWGAPLSAVAQSPAPPPASPGLKVGVMPVPPFSYKDGQGEWVGISIDLWRDVAVEMGYEYTLEEYDPKSLVHAVEQGRIDAAVTILPITSDLERAWISHIRIITPDLASRFRTGPWATFFFTWWRNSFPPSF